MRLLWNRIDFWNKMNSLWFLFSLPDMARNLHFVFKFDI
jgi:hypothetical protein